MAAATCAIKAMGAKFALGQPYGLDQSFEFVETQRGQAEALAYLLHQTLILRRVGCGIKRKVFVRIALKVANDAACNKLHIAFRRRKAYVRAAINKRRTSYAHVHLARPIVKQHAHIVAQLGATHNRVVTKEHTLASKHIAVGYELHLGHERTHRLVGRRKATRPCGGIL